MEPIERELADRRAQLQRMAADVRRLLLERIHGPDDDRKLALYSDIAKLRYEIARSEAGIRERPRTPSNPQPPLPKARQLGVVERQRIDQETRNKALGTFPNADNFVIHVNVG